VLAFFDPTVPSRAFYRPLNWTSWAIDYALWGKSSFGWHLTSMLFHAVATLAVTLLTLRLFKAWGIAILAGALFALHPSHTETVTFIGGRADLICGLFYFPAVLFYVLYRQRREEGRAAGGFYVLALATMVGAIMGKEMGVTVPVVLALTDVFFLTPRDSLTRVSYWRTHWLARIAPLVPFFVLVAAYGLMRYYLVAAGIVTNTYSGPSLLGLQGVLDATTSNILALLGVWGAPMFVKGWPAALEVGVVLLALAGAALVVRWLGRYGLYCLLWAGLTIAPTFNLSALRWLYIPSFGVCLLGALAVWKLANGQLEVEDARARQPVPGTNRKRTALALAGLLMLLWGTGVVYQNVMWYRSGEEARKILEQIQSRLPDTGAQVTVYFAEAPATYDSVLLFNTGLSAALRFYYDKPHVELHEVEQPVPDPVIAEALADPSKVRPNAVFMAYRNGQVVTYSSFEALLQATAKD
jgi:hypothetical protein